MDIPIALALTIIVVGVALPTHAFYQDWKTRRALSRLIRAGFLEGPDK